MHTHVQTSYSGSATANAKYIELTLKQFICIAKKNITSAPLAVFDTGLSLFMETTWRTTAVYNIRKKSKIVMLEKSVLL